MASEPKPELRKTSVLLDTSRDARIEEIARSNHRSLSAELRFLIDRRIAEYDDDKEQAA